MMILWLLDAYLYKAWDKHNFRAKLSFLLSMCTLDLDHIHVYKKLVYLQPINPVNFGMFSIFGLLLTNFKHLSRYIFEGIKYIQNMKTLCMKNMLKIFLIEPFNH